MRPLILCAILPLLLVGCSGSIDTTSTPATEVTPAQPNVTLKKFNQLKAGMTLAEVEALIGKGAEVSRSEVDGAPIIVKYRWDADGSGSNVSAMFQNDKLVQKNSARFEIENRRSPIM